MLTKLECAIFVMENDVVGTCKSIFNEVDNLIQEKVKLETGEDISCDEASDLCDAAMTTTEIFLCNTCSWWCEASDASFNASCTCVDCAGDDEDE